MLSCFASAEKTVSSANVVRLYMSSCFLLPRSSDLPDTTHEHQQPAERSHLVEQVVGGVGDILAMPCVLRLVDRPERKPLLHRSLHDIVVRHYGYHTADIGYQRGSKQSIPSTSTLYPARRRYLLMYTLDRSSQEAPPAAMMTFSGERLPLKYIPSKPFLSNVHRSILNPPL